MAYYFASATHQNSNGSANTDSYVMNIVAIAGLRATIQKLIGGTYATPADNAVWLRLNNSTTLLSAGGAFTPQPYSVGVSAAGTAAVAVVTTVPTIGAGVISANPKVQLAFNQRGTAMWAAFNADEGIQIQSAVAPGSEIILIDQSTGTTVPMYTTLIHSE